MRGGKWYEKNPEARWCFWDLCKPHCCSCDSSDDNRKGRVLIQTCWWCVKGPLSGGKTQSRRVINEETYKDSGVLWGLSKPCGSSCHGLRLGVIRLLRITRLKRCGKAWDAFPFFCLAKSGLRLSFERGGLRPHTVFLFFAALLSAIFCHKPMFYAIRYGRRFCSNVLLIV